MLKKFLLDDGNYITCIRCGANTFYKTKKPIRCSSCNKKFRKFSERDCAIIVACYSKPILTHKEISENYGVSREYVKDLCRVVKASASVRKDLSRYPAVNGGLSRFATTYLKAINIL